MRARRGPRAALGRRGAECARAADRTSCRILAGLMLAGCATAPRLPVRPELVSVEGPGGVAPVARLHSEITVRTHLVDPAGSRREVGDADCALATPDYGARFRTPARVLVPIWGPGSPTLDVSCAADDLRGQARQPMLTRWSDPLRLPLRLSRLARARAIPATASC